MPRICLEVKTAYEASLLLQLWDLLQRPGTQDRSDAVRRLCSDAVSYLNDEVSADYERVMDESFPRRSAGECDECVPIFDP